MASNSLKLTILSPERSLFAGEVTQVLFPGSKAPFVVLCNHAPIISTLQKGVISWRGTEEGSVTILGGFVEVKDNVATVCVEV